MSIEDQLFAFAPKTAVILSCVAVAGNMVMGFIKNLNEHQENLSKKNSEQTTPKEWDCGDCPDHAETKKQIKDSATQINAAAIELATIKLMEDTTHDLLKDLITKFDIFIDRDRTEKEDLREQLHIVQVTLAVEQAKNGNFVTK